MRFLKNWLRLERPPGLAINPSRTIEVEAGRDATFERCVDAIQQVLGGHIDGAKRAEGEIEATFGLVNSERLTVRLETIDEQLTRVRIESRRGAISEQPRRSSYVDTLAAVLGSTPR